MLPPFEERLRAAQRIMRGDEAKPGELCGPGDAPGSERPSMWRMQRGAEVVIISPGGSADRYWRDNRDPGDEDRS